MQPNTSPDSDTRRVERWFGVWLTAYERQEPIDLEHLCRDAPHLREALRHRVLQHVTTGYKPVAVENVSDTVPERIPTPRPPVGLHPGCEPLPGYRLVRLLGVGGFGEVWEARAPGEVPVALKFVRMDRDAAARERESLEFMRGIRHPHLVPHFGFWSQEQYLVIGMELAGGTLMQRLEESRRAGDAGIPFDELVGFMRQAAQGIDYLNEPQHSIHGLPGVSVLHLDIKPSNLLLAGGYVKVADFGLARTLSKTVSNHKGGMTVAYAAPEFFSGTVTRQSDQYALAVTYAELRGGRPPFAGNTYEIMGAICAGRPDLGTIPQDEHEVVRKALALHPPDRYANCREFVEALLNRAVHTYPTIPTRDAPQLVRNSIGMQLARVPAGSFLMGAPPTEPYAGREEEPVRRVTIGRSFYAGIFPVTQVQYEIVMGRNPSRFTSAAGGGPYHPVEGVSWFDAQEFCRRLSSRFEERRQRREYALPTEAEWEYLCRAGTDSPFAFGETLGVLDANFDATLPYGPVPDGEPPAATTNVGSYAANAWGMYDCHGNVWEWCADWYAADAYPRQPERDPPGPRWGRRRVLRGGAWDSPGRECRSASRWADDPAAARAVYGFRVVMAVVE